MRPEFMVWSFVRFYNYVRITGALYIPGRIVKSLIATQSGRTVGTGLVNLATPGLAVNAGYVLSFTSEEFDAKNLQLTFQLENGERFQISGTEAANYYLQHERTANKPERQFFDRLGDPGYDRILEIGSRARSGLARRDLFEGKQYTGFDVLDGPNVDIIGDAHSLSAHFAAESFDAVYSISTFEHLAMPWKVALELNHVLRMGGIAYFMTHQALGMHDMPWDFWRFSDTAWDSLFNDFTGFKKQATFLGGPMTLVPNIYHDHWKGYEAATGFSISAVLIEKTGPCNLKWDLDVRQAIRGIYPA